MEKDKDGYLLVPKEFTHKGYQFKFIKKLEGGWMIYEKTKESTKTKKYELVKPKRQDQFVFHGKTIATTFSIIPGSGITVIQL